MKILFVCLRHHYGNPEWGDSYEWNHFYQGTQGRLGEVHLYDILGRLRALGKGPMQRDLIDQVRQLRPDVVIFSLVTDEIDAETVAEIRKVSRTLCFFHDDNWRRDFVSQWAPRFDAFTTSDPNGEPKYQARGWTHAVYLPFGVNEVLFSPPVDALMRHDVTFVGGWHPYRNWLVQRLRRAGFNVRGFGERWPGGVLSTQAMIRTFAESRINLNLSNSSSWDVRYLASSPRALRNTLKSKKSSEQIKGRHFEIPSCGGMQLSYYIEGIEAQFEIGRELAIFTDPSDLVEKVRMYLGDEAARSRMAKAGRERVVRDHFYAKRFADAFRRLGWV